MNTTSQTKTHILLALAAAMLSAPAVNAQVAGGSTTTGVAVVESTQIAMGWSAKKSLLGKTVFNEAGKKVGKVEDLIVAPDKNVSYLIVGAGGFVGIGRHDVAVPVAQIQEQSGKLVMAGATPASIKALPQFVYASDTGKRDAFVAAAEKDIAKGKVQVATLQKKAATAATDTKLKLDAQVLALQGDVQSAENKLGEMKQAAATRWKEFEAGVSAATTKLRKSIDSAVG